MRTKHQPRGVSLLEILAVMAIILILLALSVSMLGGFAHTSRVVAATDTLATGFRAARHYAISENVPVMPFLLRDTEGRLTLVYGAHFLTYKGNLESRSEPGSAALKWGPTANQDGRWYMTRQGSDASKLFVGAFVILTTPRFAPENPTGVDSNNRQVHEKAQSAAEKRFDLNFAENHHTATMPFNELVYMKVTPSNDPALAGDSTQFTYEILARGLHNTERMHWLFGKGANNYGLEGFVVVSQLNHEDLPVLTKEDYRGYTIDGYRLPDHIKVDQVPDLDDVDNNDEKFPLRATVIAQDGIFRDTNKYDPKRRSHFRTSYTTRERDADGNYIVTQFRDWSPWMSRYEMETGQLGNWHAEFRPVFLPDGRAIYRMENSIGNSEYQSMDRGNLKWYGWNSTTSRPEGFMDFTLRIIDRVSRDTRYLTVRAANGAVMVADKLPAGQDEKYIPGPEDLKYTSEVVNWYDDYQTDPTKDGYEPNYPVDSSSSSNSGSSSSNSSSGSSSSSSSSSSGSSSSSSNSSSGSSNSSSGSSDPYVTPGATGDGIGDGFTLD